MEPSAIVTRVRHAWTRLTAEWPLSLLALVLVAAVARMAIAYAWGSSGIEPYDGDSGEYIIPARSLIDGLNFEDRSGNGEPMFVRTPGFPTLLAGVMLITGQDPIKWSVMLAGLSAPVALPVFSTAGRLFGRSAAWVAGVIVLIDPLSISSSTVIMTETTQGFLLALVGLGLVIAVLDGRYRLLGWGLAGVSCAVSTLVRPSTYYLVILLALFALAFLIRRGAGLRRTTAATLLLVLPSVVLLGGWQLRNQIQVDSWRFAGIEAENMYYFRAGDILAKRQGVPFDPYYGDIRFDLAPRGAGESQGSYYSRMYSEGVQIVLSEPGTAARTAARGVAWTMFAEGGQFLSRIGLQDSSPATWLLRGWIAALWLLAAIGVISGWRRPQLRWAVSSLVLLIAYVLAISAGPEAYSRFRVPVIPIVATLAAGGLWLLVEAWSRRRAVRPRVDA